MILHESARHIGSIQSASRSFRPIIVEIVPSGIRESDSSETSHCSSCSVHGMPVRTVLASDENIACSIWLSGKMDEELATINAMYAAAFGPIVIDRIKANIGTICSACCRHHRTRTHVCHRTAADILSQCTSDVYTAVCWQEDKVRFFLSFSFSFVEINKNIFRLWSCSIWQSFFRRRSASAE